MAARKMTSIGAERAGRTGANRAPLAARIGPQRGRPIGPREANRTPEFMLDGRAEDDKHRRRARRQDWGQSRAVGCENRPSARPSDRTERGESDARVYARWPRGR